MVLAKGVHSGEWPSVTPAVKGSRRGASCVIRKVTVNPLMSDGDRFGSHPAVFAAFAAGPLRNPSDPLWSPSDTPTRPVDVPFRRVDPCRVRCARPYRTPGGNSRGERAGDRADDNKKPVLCVFETVGERRLEERLAEGDRVVARVPRRGTHRGTHPRMPAPTGRSFENEAIWILTLADGRIAEIRAVSDRLGFFLQLGWDWLQAD